MKLYYTKGTCSLAIRILINELNLDCTFESVNIQTKQTETGQDFWTINPKGYVPALFIQEGFVLTENIAIQQYLVDQHSAHNLLAPLNDIKRYQTIEWLNYTSTELHKSIAPLFNSKLPKEIKAEIFAPHVIKRLKYVDVHLEKTNYLVNNTFSLADIYLFVILTWLPALKIDLTQMPKLNEYFLHLKTRPSIIKSLKDEGSL
jgi:glutathione S-transferase